VWCHEEARSPAQRAESIEARSNADPGSEVATGLLDDDEAADLTGPEAIWFLRVGDDDALDGALLGRQQ
jgi:hypothetical protein